MTPALQPRLPQPQPPRRPRPTGSPLRSRRPGISPKAGTPRVSAVARSPRPLNPTVRVLRPRPQHQPLWLWVLRGVQQTSGLTAFLAGGVIVGFYASTVYTQQQWGKAYRQLDDLQRQESQLTSAHEMLRQQLAEEAELPGSGLVAPSPNTILFLEPADPRPAPVSPPEPPAPPQLHPIGY